MDKQAENEATHYFSGDEKGNLYDFREKAKKNAEQK